MESGAATGQSEDIANLAAAIVAAQGELANPPKSKTVHAGAKKYAFAPLPEIIEAVRPVLKKHGLAVLQLVRGHELETRLMHTSGEWIGATYALPTNADSQAMGSAITYARRYSLCGILGIAADDDEDAQAATDAEQQAEQDALEARRKEAEARLAEKKKAGRKITPVEPAAKTDPEPEKEKEDALDMGSPVAPALAKLMEVDGITAEQLKAYYVKKGHFPATVDPHELPADYIAGLTKPENWKRATAAMKGAK
jgi:hypothetical protein